MFERRSALAGKIAAGGRDGVRGQRTLRISEVRGWGLAQIAVFGGREVEFGHALRPLVDADLPSAVGMQIAGKRAKIFRTTQNQYWVVTTDAPLMAELALGVPPAVGTVTALSHSRVRLAVEGPAVRTLLAKGIAIDLHSTVFRVGHFAQTGLQHTGILIERSGADRYELFLPRTFAASIWDWLVDAALPLGYDVRVQEDHRT